MKNYPPRATPAVVRDYAKEPSAASAREKAIACLSTVSRSQCNSELRSMGDARVQQITLDTPAECLIASEAKARDRAMMDATDGGRKGHCRGLHSRQQAGNATNYS
jgi:hypothetical protein